jgi:hypothetical protein
MLVAATAYGGGSSSTGGDNLAPDRNSAWFLGADRVIRVCAEIDPQFGVPLETAKDTILSGFSIWGAYIGAKKLYHDPSYKPIQRLATRVEMIVACDGTEDLKFYLGVNGPDTAAAKAEFDDPTGFARRTHYDRKQGWGKGFIWIAGEGARKPGEDRFPDWTLRDTLLAMILHELGHVYGNEHVAGTIMTSDINRLLTDSEYPADNQYRRRRTIDHARELTPACASCAETYEASSTERIGPSNNLDFDRVFRLLVGRAAMGKSKVSLTRPQWYQWSNLVLEDEAGRKTLPVSLVFALGSSLRTGEHAFRVCDPVKEKAVGPVVWGSTDYAVIQDAKGANLSMVIHWNTSESPLMLKFLESPSGPLTIQFHSPASVNRGQR